MHTKKQLSEEFLTTKHVAIFELFVNYLDWIVIHKYNISFRTFERFMISLNVQGDATVFKHFVNFIGITNVSKLKKHDVSFNLSIEIDRDDVNELHSVFS